jgi:hypothetical protein
MGLFGFGGPSEQDILMETSLAFSREIKKSKDCKKAFLKLREEIEKFMSEHCPDTLESGWHTKGDTMHDSLTSDPKDKDQRTDIKIYLMESIYYIKESKYRGNADKLPSLNDMISEYFDSSLFEGLK